MLRHQLVLGRIYWEFETVMRSSSAGLVFQSPIRVELGLHDVMVDEPDLSFVARENFDRLLRSNRIAGAPDFAVEVLSPSSGKRDREVKFALYEAYGVREYWIVDPLNQRVMMFARGERGYRAVPVNPDGSLTSTVLPDLMIDLTALFANLPSQIA